jgi:hypothetical protein
VKRFLIGCSVVLLTPLVWRGALAAFGPPDVAPPSYLPALERTRERKPFDDGVVQGLQRMDPAFVIIGDSMAGRVEFAHLRHVTKETVAPLLQNATGSAYWYLAFKNYVVASGVTPKWTLVFFRDTNLTDPMFRLTEPNRSGLDEAASDYEEELNEVVAARNTGAWRAVHRLADRAYDVERTRAWLEPVLAGWPARMVAGPDRGADLLVSMNEAFSLERLRPIPQSDIDADADRRADFHANVAQSVLPLFIKLSREAKLRLCFVRVLRRTVNDEPPSESRALTRYAIDLRTYLEAEGVAFLDDRDDPRLHTIKYADGDHIDRGELPRYTEILVERLNRLTGR